MWKRYLNHQDADLIVNFVQSLWSFDLEPVHLTDDLKKLKQLVSTGKFVFHCIIKI